MITQPETKTKELTPEQRVHADLYGKDPDTVPVPKEPSNGGSICTICRRKGCTIGPMGRG